MSTAIVQDMWFRKCESGFVKMMEVRCGGLQDAVGKEENLL